MILNRVFSLIILFTPSLGLFNTLHHGRLAAMSLRRNNIKTFDYSNDGMIITFEDAWNQFRIDDSSDFVEISSAAALGMVLAMFMFHVFACSCILKLALKGSSILSLLPRGFYTLISPPLHYDWEFFYMQSNEENPIAIVKSWKKCMHASSKAAVMRSHCLSILFSSMARASLCCLLAS